MFLPPSPLPQISAYKQKSNLGGDYEIVGLVFSVSRTLPRPNKPYPPRTTSITSPGNGTSSGRRVNLAGNSRPEFPVILGRNRSPGNARFSRQRECRQGILAGDSRPDFPRMFVRSRFPDNFRPGFPDSGHVTSSYRQGNLDGDSRPDFPVAFGRSRFPGDFRPGFPDSGHVTSSGRQGDLAGDSLPDFPVMFCSLYVFGPVFQTTGMPPVQVAKAICLEILGPIFQ